MMPQKINPNRIRHARRTLAEAFMNDSSFYQAYAANVAMLLHDRYGITDQRLRNEAAEEILHLLFGDFGL